MYRPEHPKPQFRRDKWINLNGLWDFAFDFGLSGEERGMQTDSSLYNQQIQVPFCPESKLSGIGYTDFIPAAWYLRTFEVPEDWQADRVFLHFGAVDYDCQVWVNGKWAGRHYGGAVSFCFDITALVESGENVLAVLAKDDPRSGIQPVGKQSRLLASHDCDYTRTTGIWQTVWLESRPKSHLENMKLVADLDSQRFHIATQISGNCSDMQLQIEVSASGNRIASVAVPAVNGVPVPVDIPNARHWSPEDPYLYDIKLTLKRDQEVVDTVHSYAGMRKFRIEGNCFYLNNKKIFLRMVLDQGFYPDGIWTAPTDEDLRADIERAKSCGFNGARLHQKVFEERFHYWADTLGYLTWGEYCDWGMDFSQPQTLYNQQSEWTEVLVRDINHCSIIAWTPFNESIVPYNTDPEVHRRTLEDTYALTKALDPTRPVNDASGYVHVRTDIYTLHNYEQDPAVLADTYAELSPDSASSCDIVFSEQNAPYQGQPFVVDEYGGTWWMSGSDKTSEGSWGYGQRPKSIEEVYRRIEQLTRVLTENPNIAGFCYTQLTDIEQECNGLYTYDRQLKFDLERLKRAFATPAAIER